MLYLKKYPNNLDKDEYCISSTVLPTSTLYEKNEIIQNKFKTPEIIGRIPNKVIKPMRKTPTKTERKITLGHSPSFGFLGSGDFQRTGAH